MDGYPYIDRLRGKEEFDQLVVLSKADNHGVYVPTHPVRKNGELVGYFSINSPGVPIVWAWLSTKQLHARESLGLINTVENAVHLANNSGIAFPVPKESPFHALMEKLGYVNTGSYDFFVKQF